MQRKPPPLPVVDNVDFMIKDELLKHPVHAKQSNISVVTELISADTVLSKTAPDPRESAPSITMLQLLAEESKYIREEDQARAATAAIAAEDLLQTEAPRTQIRVARHLYSTRRDSAASSTGPMDAKLVSGSVSKA